MSRGTNRLAQDPVPNARLQAIDQHQIHLPPQKVLEPELQIHVAVEGMLVEIDEQVDVTVLVRLVARERAEQGDGPGTEGVKLVRVRFEPVQDGLSVEHSGESVAAPAPVAGGAGEPFSENPAWFVRFWKRMPAGATSNESCRWTEDDDMHLPLVVRAGYRGERRMHITFPDEVEGTVDCAEWLSGPVFEPLRDLSSTAETSSRSAKMLRLWKDVSC